MISLPRLLNLGLVLTLSLSLTTAYSLPQSQAQEPLEKGQNGEILWDLSGWIYVIPIEENGNTLEMVDDQNNPPAPGEEIPGFTNFMGIQAIIDFEAFSTSGYHYIIRRKNNQEVKLGLVHFLSNEESLMSKYTITNLPQSINRIELANPLTATAQTQLKLNNSFVEPEESQIDLVTEEDREANIQVSSEKEFVFENIDGSVTTADGTIVEPAPNKNTSKGTVTSVQDEEEDFTFTDIRSPILQRAVAYLAKADIISGYSDQTFRPEQTINRAEALKIIFAALGVRQGSSVPSDPFPDVERSQWFAPYVATAKAQGIIGGYPDGSFRPTEFVNKAEFIKMAMSAQSTYSKPSDFSAATSQYEDLDTQQWYMPYVSYAADKDYLDKTNKLHPTDGMSRGEAALMIYRVLTQP